MVKIMKINDINRKLTEKVAEYLTKGYIINTMSMSGHQGEVGKVDLLKGNELIRVWINSESNWSDPDGFYGNKLVLRVSKWKHPYDSRRDITVWNSEMIHKEEYVYYEIGRYNGNIWYLDNLEDALACVKKGNKRYSRRRVYGSTLYDITSEVTKEIATKYLKNHKDYQRVSRDKITVCKRVHHGEESAPDYIIKYGDSQVYRLK